MATDAGVAVSYLEHPVRSIVGDEDGRAFDIERFQEGVWNSKGWFFFFFQKGVIRLFEVEWGLGDLLSIESCVSWVLVGKMIEMEYFFVFIGSPLRWVCLL